MILGHDPYIVPHLELNFHLMRPLIVDQMVAPRVAPTKKGFFGNMSPEELKDFKETLAEMDFGVDQEFLAGGNFGRTQEYGALPYSFDESSMSEMQKRKKLFPFLA